MFPISQMGKLMIDHFMGGKNEMKVKDFPKVTKQA